MRIITGSLRGLKLKSLDGLDVRPTSDMVKEAMFSAVQFEIEGKIVADLFAGSGQLGIEALSRGAAKAYFSDNNRQSIEIIRDNIKSAELSADVVTVKEMPAQAFIKNIEPIDLAFLDPPYERRHLQKILPKLAEKMARNGIIVCEHEMGCILPDEIGTEYIFKITKTYRYGKIGVTIYRNKEGETDS